MSIESQRQLDARHKELRLLAKENVCNCGGELEVARLSLTWWLWCASCQSRKRKYQIKSRPTSAELVAERIAKMEAAAAKPTSKYNIDELFKD